jgi:hypothetical protein
MKLPKTIAAWCQILFFLVFGINAFVAIPFGGMILGVLALGVAVFTVLER